MEGKALAFLVCVYTRSLVSHKPVHSFGKLPERFNAPTINFSMSNRVLFRVFKTLTQMVKPGDQETEEGMVVNVQKMQGLT